MVDKDEHEDEDPGDTGTLDPDDDLGRELGARTVLFHQAVADRLGIGLTDQKCLDFVFRAGRDQPVTAGQLAELTGLTTGAITGVIDRLEKAGLIRREKHPHDRRQVVVRVIDDRARELAEIFGPFGRAWQELYARYSAEQRETIRDVLGRAGTLLAGETERLRGRAPGSPGRSERAAASVSSVSSAPLGEIQEGHLDFTRAVQVAIGACDDQLLYRARFERAVRIGAEGGAVTVVQRHGLTSWFGGQPGELLLSERIPWTVRLRGASRVEADLRRLRLAAFEVASGASEVGVRLSRPTGTVPFSLRGGASKVRVTVPAGVPFRFLARGGASSLTLDRLQLGAVGGDVRWESPDYATSPDRYDLDVRGGASNLSVLAE
jgi:DNA-binding MarR family transcriptional regulator